MKKRMIILLTLALCLVVAGQAFGSWGRYALQKTLNVNVGLWAPLSSEVTYENGRKVTSEYADYNWLVSFGAKLYFYESNLGVGVDGILLDRQTLAYNTSTEIYDWQTGSVTTANTAGEATLTQWLVDVDVFYRLPVIPRLNAFGAAGLTYFVFNSGGHPGYKDSSSKAGYNVKLGGEYFIDEDISVSAVWAWHQFGQGVIGGTTDTSIVNQNASVKLFSFLVQASLYL